ncbi:MAG: ATP-binding protein [Gammaproteobacteria bacterium]|nr:ATP-binding protein [Gammaproteobacteria bacterium]
MSAMTIVDNSLLKLLFEKSLTPIAYMDLKYNFIHVNQGYAAANSKPVDYFTGKNHFELYPNAENKRIFDQVVRTGKAYETKAREFENVEEPEKGVSYWDWSLTVVKDNDGNDAGLLLQLIDVTCQIKVEQKLLNKVKKEYANYDEELEAIIESRTNQLQDAISLLEIENAERVKAEALLTKAKEEAEKANISKSQFLSRMSHELRTPMNAILGFSQLLQINELNEIQSSYNDEILLAGNHLLSMISDILDLSRIEEGSLPVSITNVLLGQLIEESISLVQHKLDFRNITIQKLIEKSDKTILKVDETRLKEVLVNLLTNAVKYNTDDGLVSIGYKSRPSGYIQIYVSDTGKGLSEEEQEKIFEPFNRLGAEYTDIEGVGIGLAISKKLMEMMDGSITIESKKGKGSTFYIDCPVGKQDSKIENAAVDVNLENVNGVYNVLYVEDNKSNQRVIEDFFATFPNLNLTIESCAEDALRNINQYNFDVILMDINLPGMDGFSVLEQLKQDAATKNIPVIALTASAGINEIKKGLKAGFDHYVTKPVVLPELISIINKELNQIEKY